jgi:biopolymer transport protein ExbD
MPPSTKAEALSASQRNKVRKMAAPPEGGHEEGGEINVVPFLDIITNVLMFVLATLAVTFTSTIESTPPRRPGPRVTQTLGFTVVVVPEGFSVKARGGNVAPGCTDTGPGIAIPKRDGHYDYAALQACAAKLKGESAAFADENAVTITASPQVPYDALIGAIDAVRRSNEGKELFPEVSFAIGR